MSVDRAEAEFWSARAGVGEVLEVLADYCVESALEPGGRYDEPARALIEQAGAAYEALDASWRALCHGRQTLPLRGCHVSPAGVPRVTDLEGVAGQLCDGLPLLPLEAALVWAARFNEGSSWGRYGLLAPAQPKTRHFDLSGRGRAREFRVIAREGYGWRGDEGQGRWVGADTPKLRVLAGTGDAAETRRWLLNAETIDWAHARGLRRLVVALHEIGEGRGLSRSIALLDEFARRPGCGWGWWVAHEHEVVKTTIRHQASVWSEAVMPRYGATLVEALARAGPAR